MELSSKNRCVLDILNRSVEYLSKKGIENSRLNAERLLGSTLNMDRVNLYLNFDRPLSEVEIDQFKKKLRRRARKEPLQYILGETEFMSLPFRINSSVLIPRPETEILVEHVIEKCQTKFESKKNLAILDLGTGSGCIAIALANYLRNVHITALDFSQDALRTAKENAILNRVDDRISFAKIDFLSTGSLKNLSEKFDVIVSNPPYVSSADYEKLPEEIRNFEPSIALHDNEDGLNFYRRIAALSSDILDTKGFLALEVGLGQTSTVKELMLRNKFSCAESFRDLNGIERIIICEY